jgi:FkbM family methyltransferase
MKKAFGKIFSIVKGINEHPLANKHKLKSYSKFVYWQFSKLFNSKLTKVHFLQNTYLYAKKGMAGATGNIYCGLHEFEDMSFLLHFLKEEDTFIDVGANIGSYTILASGVNKATTISIEPVPSTFYYLQKNVELNALANRTILWNAAAGAHNNKIKFTKNYDTVNHALSKGEIHADYIEVDVFPLSYIMHGKTNVRLIKIDVEGFETDVLNGMESLLNNHELKAIIIELNGSGDRYGYDEKKIHEKLKDKNFLPYSYDPFKRSFLEINQFSNKNTKYIRDIDFVLDRITRAKKINIFSESF